MRRSPRSSYRAARGIALALAALLVGPTEARAQLNAEALRSTLRKNPRFLWIDGALVGRAGNTQTTTFSGSVFGGVSHEPHLFFTRVSGDYGEARGSATVARWVGHTRYNYRLTRLVALEGLAQVQHDRFRRLSVRDLYGVGVRLHLHEAEELDVFAGTTYMVEHEVISDRAGSPGTKELWTRSSNYVGLNARVAPLVEASAVTYAQPRFDKPQDIRVLSEGFVSITITKRLAARVSGSVWIDSEPPAEVRSYDVEVKNSLAFKLD
jgi:hypothetical protein